MDKKTFVYETIDVQTGSGDVVSQEEAAYLASEHAREATKVLNEFAVYMRSSSGGWATTPVPLTVAQTHAQIAQAYAAIANQSAIADSQGG